MLHSLSRQSGGDLVFLQEQMGYKNLRTTIRYIVLCVERQRFMTERFPQNGMKHDSASSERTAKADGRLRSNRWKSNIENK